MKGCLNLIFETKNPNIIYDALAPELDEDIQRSNVDLFKGQNSIELCLKGEDVTSLRAAVNTWIRLVKIAFEMVNI